MKQNLNLIEKKYWATFKMGKDNHEDISIIEDEGKRIKIELYQERWRTPEEQIKLYELAIQVIKNLYATK